MMTGMTRGPLIGGLLALMTAPLAAQTTARFPQPPKTVEAAKGDTPRDADILNIADGDWLTSNRTLAGDRF